MDNRQYRAELIKRMVNAYRAIKKLDKKLAEKHFSRVFRNPKCPTAVKIGKAKVELLEYRAEEMQILSEAFRELPEVRHMTEETEIGIGPMEFAAKCAAKPRRRRFMKNQLELAS